MLEEGRINWRQLFFLIAISRLVRPITYIPGLTAPPFGHDILLTNPVIMVISWLLAAPLLFLARRFPGQTLVEYSVTLLGPAGKVIGLLYIWFFLHASAIFLRQFSEFFINAIMPETPLLVFILAMALLAAAAARNGLEVISRTGEIIGPLVIFSIILIFFFLLKDLDPGNFLPFLDMGPLPILYGSVTISLAAPELLFLAMAAPFLNRKRELGKAALASILTFTLAFVLIEGAIIGLFGDAEARSLTFPFFSAVQMVNIGNILQRIEAVYIGAWFFGSFISVTCFYYLAALGTAQLLGLKDYKPLVLPLGSIIVALAVLLFASSVELKEFISYKIWTPYASLFLVFIPLLLLLVALVSKKGGVKA